MNRLLVITGAVGIGAGAVYLAVRSVHKMAHAKGSRAGRAVAGSIAAFAGLMGLALVIAGIATMLGHPPSERLFDRSIIAFAWVAIGAGVLMVIALPIVGYLEGKGASSGPEASSSLPTDRTE